MAPNGEERRDQSERLTRVETVVENLGKDVDSVTKTMIHHMEEDSRMHAELNKSLTENHYEMTSIAKDVHYIAQSTHNNSEEIRKFTKWSAMIQGGWFVAVIFSGIVWAIITYFKIGIS